VYMIIYIYIYKAGALNKSYLINVKKLTFINRLISNSFCKQLPVMLFVTN